MSEKKLVLVIADGGGRGHALHEALDASERVERTIVMPGNAGIPNRDCLPLDNMKNVTEIALGAKSARADAVIAGSEVSLLADEGLVAACATQDIMVVGPSRDAAMLEGSKLFAKGVMHSAGVGDRTGRYEVAYDYEEARRLILKLTQEWGVPPVIKADGVCAGKGVTVADTIAEAYGAAYAALVNKTHGNAGDVILLEEPFKGEEVSLFYLCDGENAMSLMTARDWKRRSAEPGAPNTGGMGAVAPVPGMEGLLAEVRDELVAPVLKEMRRREASYHGVLYVGVMLTENGWKVLEFNCRFGDPEAQVILPLLDCDIVPYLFATTGFGGLAKLPPPRFKKGFAVCVVLADSNYGKQGAKIGGHSFFLPETIGKHQRLFHAGTKWETGNGIVNVGGRIFNAVGLGETVAEACEEAYALAKEVKGPLYYRKDIALGM